MLALLFAALFYFSKLCWYCEGLTTQDSFFAGLPDENYIVLIISRLGLANRLRALADWHQLAILSNRTLTVSWEPTVDCNAKFEDLFEGFPPGITFLPFTLPPEEEGIRYVESLARKYGATSYPIYDIERFLLPREIIMSDVKLIVTAYNGIVALDGINCLQYTTMHSQFLNSLKPYPADTELIDNIKSQYFSRHVMIGVHYREHDKTLDWEVVPPIAGGSRANAFGVGATVQHFEEAMRMVESKFSILAANGTVIGSAARFFIASNSQIAKDYLLSKFPNAVAIRGDYSRSSKEGVQFALLEWLLLSESSLLINTYGSSFAVEASQRHLRPIVGVWDSKLIYYSNNALPFCGNMQFAKAYSHQTQQASYVEGTSDQRLVNSVAVRLSYCNHLAEWGLPDVYCLISD